MYSVVIFSTIGMGWKELDGRKMKRILSKCENVRADLALLKSGSAIELNHGSEKIPGDDATAAFVCVSQRDGAVLDMLALCKIFQLSIQVFSQAVAVFDQFLSVIKVRSKFLNCICLSCIYIALHIEQSNENNFGPPKASDVNRFISASESRCTYSDVVRMADVIVKKLGLNVQDGLVTLYDVLMCIHEIFPFGSHGSIFDFYATCLCYHEITLILPRYLLLAILGIFMKTELVMKIKHELTIATTDDFVQLCEKVKIVHEEYVNSGKPKKRSTFGALKKYIFKISQRTGQALMASKARILALASSTNKLAPILEEHVTSAEDCASNEQPEDWEIEVSSTLKDSSEPGIEEPGPPLRKKRKTQKYAKLPFWFGFSNHATARACKPYYQHLVSSWSPWNLAPDHKTEAGARIEQQLLSVFLIN